MSAPVEPLRRAGESAAGSPEAVLRRMAIERCGPDAADLELDADLVAHLGLDSLELLALVAEAEKRWGLRIPDRELPRLRTLGQILQAVMKETA